MFQDLVDSLKNSGMRLTATRIAICQYLSETGDHPSASQIYQHLKKQYPSLSLATVYNTLDVLVKMGVINVLGHIGDGNVHFDADTHPHINLACLKCHSIVDFPSAEPAQMEEVISLRSGFKLLGARVVYYGICPQCQATA